MDQESANKLQEITSHEPAALSESDKDFLRARRAYLNEDQRVVFADVLGENPAQQAPVVSQEPKLEELKARGALLGLTYKVGTTKIAFQKAVEEAEAAANSPVDPAQQAPVVSQEPDASEDGAEDETSDEEV